MKILTYEQVISLTPKSRDQYMRSVAKLLVRLDELRQTPAYSFWQQLFSFGSVAYASKPLLCIGGGFPVDSGSPTCGVSKFQLNDTDFLQCTGAGETMCNPMIFGVNKDGSPVCNKPATTEWCFRTTRLGDKQTLDPVFQKMKPERWRELRDKLNNACANPSLIQESAHLVRSACDYTTQQMAHNEDVKKLMKEGYSYDPEPPACIAPSVNLAAYTQGIPNSREKAFIDEILPVALEIQKRDRYPACAIIAQLALESGFGTARGGGHALAGHTCQGWGSSKTFQFPLEGGGNYTFAGRCNFSANGQNFLTFRKSVDSIFAYRYLLIEDPDTIRNYGSIRRALSNIERPKVAKCSAMISMIAKSGYATDPGYEGKLKGIVSRLNLEMFDKVRYCDQQDATSRPPSSNAHAPSTST